jgi:hypothetical protein
MLAVVEVVDGGNGGAVFVAQRQVEEQVGNPLDAEAEKLFGYLRPYAGQQRYLRFKGWQHCNGPSAGAERVDRLEARGSWRARRVPPCGRGLPC